MLMSVETTLEQDVMIKKSTFVHIENQLRPVQELKLHAATQQESLLFSDCCVSFLLPSAALPC